jgi:hypothetical protein
MFAIGAACSYFLFTQNLEVVAWLLVGMCFGGAVRDLSYYRLSSELWPHREQMINRRRVNELLDFDTGA